MLLVIVLAVAIQIPKVQNYAVDKATTYLSNKLHTRVEIGEIGITFPKSVYLKNIYLEDLQKDTLLYSKYIKVNLDMMGLLNSNIEINSLRIDDLTSHIKRTLPDSAFNFDFIAEAFAGDTTTQTEKDTSGGMQFAIYDIELNNIHLKYNDAVSGMDVNSKIGHFETDIDAFDLDKMRFAIDDIALENSYADVTQNKVPEDTIPEPESALPDIELNTASLANVRFNYINKADFQQIKTNIGSLQLTADELDLKNQRIALDELVVKNSHASFALNKNINADTLIEAAKKVTTEGPKEKAKPSQWVVTLEKLKMQENGFAFDNFNEKRQAKGMDFSHLNFKDINIDVNDIFYSVNKTTADAEHISLKDTSGFVLKNFTANIIFDSIHTELQDLLIETPQSKIADYLAVRYSSLDAISENIGDLLVQVNMENSHVNFHDILLLQPDLASQPPFAGNSNRTVNMDGKIDGLVKNLQIHEFRVSTANNTTLVLQGNIKGLPDAEKAYFDISFPKFTSSRGDIYALIPRKMLPDAINIPGSILARGFFRGSIADFATRADINTSMGDISALAYMQMPKNALATYKINASARKFDVGKLVKGQDSTLGPVTMKAEINGAGLDLKEMNTDVKVDMQSARILKYTYKDLALNGKIQNEAFTGHADMQDTSIAFVFDGMVGLTDSNPSYKFTLDVLGADLQKLHFTEDDLRFKAKLSADITGNNLNDITGNVNIGDVLIVKNDKEYPIRSFLAARIKGEENNSIDIKSDFLDASFKGTINLGDLGTELTRHFNRYFTLHYVEQKKQLQPQNFTFDIDFKKTEIITDIFYPDLKRIIPGTIHGNYNSTQQDLNVAVNIPQIIYLDYTLDTIKIDINSDAQRLNYNVGLVQLSSSTIFIENPSVSGKVENDSITVAVQSKDDEDKVKFLLAGIMQSEPDKNYHFSFLPDGVIFNYEQWAATPGNYIRFGEKMLYAKDVKLSSANHSLTIDSKGERDNPDAPLNVNFQNFDLATVSAFIQKDKNLVSGLINGDVVLENLQKTMAFQTDLNIKSFSYLGDTLGDVAVKADNKTANRYTANLRVTGNGNNLLADGYYITNEPANAYNFDVDIKSLNLSSIEAYMAGQLRDMSGAINGNLRLSGSTDAPNINGKVNFDNSAFTVDVLGSHYQIDDEAIIFNNSGINFPDITIRDSLNNTADVSGYVYTKYFKEFRFNLDLNSDNFRVMSSTEKDNEMYYGKVFVSSRIHVGGDLNHPVVTGRIRLNEGTEVSVVLPTDNAELVSREGVVEFIAHDSTGSDKIMYKDKGADTVKTQFTGLELNANIEVDKAARLKIVIDPDAGDYLDVAGTGTLSLGLSPGGSISLTGRYEIAEGNYQLTFYNFVKRKFSITSGSTITWLGSPTDATLNITAQYTTEAAPLELVDQMVSTDNELERNKYKQKLPFEVELNMTGQLMKPVINLNIDMPEDQRGAFGGLVYNRIYQLRQNESELNKQVFALLVLGRFLAEDPLKSEGGGNAVNNAINSSLSELLSQQLNAFASKYIKDVDINLEVDRHEDYSTGVAEERTDVKLGLSKTLFNDRLTINVGSDVNVEGSDRQSAENTSEASQIVSDVSVEYKITKDGRLRLTLFRNNEYAGVIEGQLVETGAGIIFVRDFNKFKYLFTKPRDRNDL